MQRVKNDQPGSVQTRVDATRANQMALMFFHTKASSTHTLYPGGKLSRSVQQGALARFMLVFKMKRTTLFSALGQRPGWYAVSVQENWQLKGTKTILPASPQLTYSSSGEWCGSWLASPCPRTAWRRAGRGLSQLLPKMSAPEHFGGGWSSSKI